MKIVSLSAILILFSCGNQEENITYNNGNELNKPTPASFDSSNTSVILDIQDQENLTNSEENEIIVEFEDFKLQIDTLEIWNDSNIIQAEGDTAHVILGLGYGIEGATVKIITNNKMDFTIFQRYETSVTVMNEGPHCDLYDWRHFNSEWNKINVSKNLFIAESYKLKEREMFIEVSMKDVQNAVQKQCGNDWSQLLEGINSVSEYPCGIGISCIYLKIVYRTVGSDISTTKYVAFDVPMGC